MKTLPFKLLSILFITLLSCRKEIDFENEDHDTKIVVSSLFNTDSSWQVEISETRSVLDKEKHNLVEDATVKITDEHGSVISLEYISDGKYRSPLKPILGGNYMLDIYTPKLGTAKAECALPKEMNTFKVENAGTQFVNLAEWKNIKLTFSDNKSEQNSYVVQFFHYELIDGFLSKVNPVIYNTDLFIQTEIDRSDFYFEGITFNDESFNGSTIEMNFAVDLPSNQTIFVAFKSMSSEFTLYNETYLAYSESIDVPILVQPVQVYSNVENGVGIFAGYNLISDSLILQ